MKSCKQKVVSRSSTEAELNAVYDFVPQIIWIKQLISELFPNRGDVNLPAVLHQDNMSTITLAEKGQFLIAKSKHALLRYNFVNEQVKDGKILVKYLPTGEMKADPLTKPMPGEKARRIHLNS